MKHGIGALLLSFFLWQSGESSADRPRTEEFVRGVRQALQQDDEILEDFWYIERRRDVRVSRLGKVTVGPLRTFEVYPSAQPGRTYKRLIAVDGKPLTPEELARRDAEHQRDLQREAERERSASSRERTERLRKIEEERQHRLAMLDDAVAVFEPKFGGRETIEGRSVVVADLRPRAAAQVKTREGRWMKHFAGRVWIDASNYQVVRLEMRAFEDVTIGWGIVGRLHKGSWLRYSRRLYGSTWFPAELSYHASGRTLVFRPFEFTATTTYSDYRRR